MNTFRNPHGDTVPEHLELIRSSDEQKQWRLKRMRDFQKCHTELRAGKDLRPVPQEHVVVQDRNRWV